MPKWDWPNRDVAKTYQLVPKWDWLIWGVKKTCQVMPKMGGTIWDVTKTYHRHLRFMKVKSLLAWTLYFHINRLVFQQNSFIRCDLAWLTPSLCKGVFSPYENSLKHIHEDDQLTFCSILMLNGSQNTVYRGPYWDAIMTSQLVRKWDGPICMYVCNIYL